MRLVDGRAEPVFASDPAKAKLDPACAEIQRGALAFVQDFARAGGGAPPRLAPAFARELIEQLIHQPTEAQAVCVGSLPYDKSSFNRDDSSTFLPPPEYGLEELRRRPRQLLSDFQDSNWRHGFLASRRSDALRQFLLASTPVLWEEDRLPARAYDQGARAYRRLRSLLGIPKVNDHE